MRLPPRLVVAGPRSGVGKTTVATGLIAALAARGTRVAAAKVGPDFIDPGYHALASGRPPRNLDVVMHGEHRVASLLAHAASDAEVAIVEGVMGLLDGRAAGPSPGRYDEGSTAHVAALLQAPVLLVVDASATSRSIAAEVHGFATFDPRVRIAGVVVNGVGSEGHEALVREALHDVDVPVVGVLHRRDEVVAPSRHLGLVPAAERDDDAAAAVRDLAGLVTRHLDLDAVVSLARAAPPVATPAWDPATEVATARAATARVGTGPPGSSHRRPLRVAVAGGRAFTFAYTEHRELLEAAGAEIVTVDPLVDETLPEGCDALVLGGGFPETHAAQLSANVRLRAEVAAHARRGAPVVAECGGLLYLTRDLDGHEMCGVLDATARFTDRLTLGYREATLPPGTVLGRGGVVVRGHEFHRTVVEPAAGPAPAWHLGRPAAGSAPAEPAVIRSNAAGPGESTASGQADPAVIHRNHPAGGAQGRADPADPANDRSNEGFAQGGVHASYLHASWVGTPGLATRLVDAAVGHREVTV